jgi:hypothetical protein
MNSRNEFRGDLHKAKNVIENDAKNAINNARTGLGNVKNNINNALASHMPNSPVITYEVDGYEFVENSLSWKLKCMGLPCSSQDWWAGYITKVIKDVTITVPGLPQLQPVIIQLWKGWCQRLGGRISNSFPGGIGSEVGIYYYVPPSQASNLFGGTHWIYGPTSFGNQLVSTGRNDVKQVVQKNSTLGPIAAGLPRQQSPTDPSSEVWYPIPQAWWPNLWSKLVNPATGEELTHTTTQRTYWLTRWMDPKDYFTKYQKCHSTPRYPANYRLYFSVNGKQFDPW